MCKDANPSTSHFTKPSITSIRKNHHHFKSSPTTTSTTSDVSSTSSSSSNSSSHNQIMTDLDKVKAIMSSKHKKKASNHSPIDYVSYSILFLIILITIFTCPTDWSMENKVTVHHVWYKGWITGVATGVGVLPFFFLSSEPNKFWMGISNGK